MRLTGTARRVTAFSIIFNAAFFASLLISSECASAGPVNYSIIAVKAPRYGDDKMTYWQEVISPARVEPGQDLVLIKPDGSEEVLVNCSDKSRTDHFNNHFPEHTGKVCSVIDPCMSLDGESVYFSVLFQGDRKQFLSNGLPDEGADIFRMKVISRQLVRLTNQEYTPNTGKFNWAKRPQQLNNPEQGVSKPGGVFNVGACPVAGPIPGNERVIFTSSRDILHATRNHSATNPNMHLYLMDGNGENVRHIGHMNLAGAMHPVPLKDGRVAFSTLESQGTHTNINWGLWGILPDGRGWEPLWSALTWGVSAHFAGQSSDGSIFTTLYYNQNNNGFGTLVAFPSERAPGQAAFGSPKPTDPTNALLQEGWWGVNWPRYIQFSFSPIGARTLTAFSRSDDWAAPKDPTTGQFLGKVTHPSGAPDNDVLLVYSKGPANSLDRPTTKPMYLGGIYLLKNMQAIVDPKNLIVVKEDPAFNYQQPRAAVAYKAIYGVREPTYVPYLPDGETPFGLIGTASFYNRNTGPGVGEPSYNGLDAFNDAEHTTNWESQGADAGLYFDKDIYAVRILAMEPLSNVTNGYAGFVNIPEERLRILGEIPLRKPDQNGVEPLDGDGNHDTSFLAKIPADVPFTFQTIDKRGMVLNHSQTWHQVRPGEKRFDCGGCHAHANKPTDFSKTAAAKPGYVAWDLIDKQPLLSRSQQGITSVVINTGADRAKHMNVEFIRDIKPILDRSCVGCHSQTNPGGPAAKLDLGDYTLGWYGTPKAWACLVSNFEKHACDGYPFARGAMAASNASRWIRKSQSRRSLLIWKIFGERLDGWKNEDHPTETVPGDLSTFPAGANNRLADIDYTGTIMPPPGSGFPALTEDEKMLFVRWIDTGATINVQGKVATQPEGILNLFADDLRPTLNVAWPRSEHNGELRRLSFAAYDYESGLDTATFKVTADFAVNGAAPGTNLVTAFTEKDNVWSLQLATPIKNLARGKFTVEVSDKYGHKTSQEVIFSVGESGGVPQPEPSPFVPLPTPNSTRIPLETPTPGGTVTPVPGGPGGPGAGGNAAPFLAVGLKNGMMNIRMRDDGLPSVAAPGKGKKGAKAPKVMSKVTFKVYVVNGTKQKLIKKWSVKVAKSKMYKTALVLSSVTAKTTWTKTSKIMVQASDGNLSSTAEMKGKRR